MSEQNFYYYMLGIAIVGMWASSYTFIHTPRKNKQHKAAVVLLGLFALSALVSILGIGDDLPVALEDSLTLWVLMAITVYTGIKAIDKWVDNADRRANICKQKEFNRMMREKGNG